jgi:DNA polymerase elongation subunit (family B)
VAGEYRDLVNLADEMRIEGMSLEERFVKSEDEEPSKVLKVPVQNSHEAESLAEKILVHGRYKRYELYNVDVKPSQLYMYEKGIYPFAYVKAVAKSNQVLWQIQDSLKSVDYKIPPLREITLSTNIRKKRRLPTKADPIEKITLTSQNEICSVNEGDENQNLLRLVETIEKFDPDVIYTSNGDDFLFPYLAHRAAVNGISDEFILGREQSPLQISHEKGQSYVSYGRVCYRPIPTRLLGRLHIDRENSILYRDCGLPGIIEVARLCRIPAQRASNTTIGTSMTSAQFYEASRQHILIPWQKADAEELKTASDLLVADRGGFYYEPIMGLHEGVGELDFTSLYPMIMLTKNLSGETVCCKCCPDSKNRVPELGYNICEKKMGIVPRSLKLLIEKRRRYKELKQITLDNHVRSIYEKRQIALKWILVTSFGYLGFKNARFGKIDAHIATCAFARQILKDTVHLAEARGFKLIHGIVDSLWLKKDSATEEDYLKLKADIEKMMQLPISFEGIYRWIVFLPSKTHRNVPVLSRYYGVFRNGKIKDRGIATRRDDTPPIVNKCIWKMLSLLAEAKDAEEFYTKLPSACKVVERCVDVLRSGDVSLEELVIRKRLSYNPNEYRNMVLHAVAANQLVKEGAPPNAGESVNYIITNSQSRFPSKRVLDAEAYVGLLTSAAETMFMCFENLSMQKKW